MLSRINIPVTRVRLSSKPMRRPSQSSACIDKRKAICRSGEENNQSASDDGDHEERAETRENNPAFTPSILRLAAAAKTGDEALIVLSGRAKSLGRPVGPVLLPAEASEFLSALVGFRRIPLALTVHEAMRLANSGPSRPGWNWPPADIAMHATLIRSLAQTLAVSEALSVISDIRWRGVPAAKEVAFGKVVCCPNHDMVSISLALVQPHEGSQRVACGSCRYDYDIFSGTVRRTKSEATNSADSFPILTRSLGFLKSTRGAAVHELDVLAPSGIARTFRVATTTADVPAQDGDRITVVCACSDSADMSSGGRRRIISSRILPARMPGKKAGEPLEITNLTTGRRQRLCRAPQQASSALGGSASSYLPAALLLLAAGDGASALIDPSLPGLIALGFLGVSAAGAAGKFLVLPRLAQLPISLVQVDAVRQKLLGQHEQLQERLAALATACETEVRTLARLWQLENKMKAVNEDALYTARIERVRAARKGIDANLEARLELIDKYAKVAAMIEIEIEMDSDVANAELKLVAEGIDEEISRIEDVEALNSDWIYNAEAANDVEKLLRSGDANG